MVVKKVRGNAYEIELPADIQIYATFNVRDLTSYLEDDKEYDEDLSTNPLQGLGIDMEQVSSLGLLSLVRGLEPSWPNVDPRSRTMSPWVNIHLGLLKRSK